MRLQGDPFREGLAACGPEAMMLQGDPFRKGLAVCGPERLPIGVCTDVSTACGMLPLAHHKDT